MQCELVFYVARKTGNNEQIFTKKLSNTELKVVKTMVATSPLDLGEQLKASLKRSNLVFILGGLQRDDETNIVEILSKSLESNSKQQIICKRIENTGGKEDGYIVQSGKQMIVMLPDNPEELKIMVGYVLLKYISEFYNLKFNMKNDKKENIKFETIDNADEFLSRICHRASFDFDEEFNDFVVQDEEQRNPTRAIAITLTLIGVAAAALVFLYLTGRLTLPF